MTSPELPPITFPPPPWPDGPCVATVPLKPCCREVLVGEECSCADFFAELVAACQSPLLISADGESVTMLPPLTGDDR